MGNGLTYLTFAQSATALAAANVLLLVLKCIPREFSLEAGDRRKVTHQFIAVVAGFFFVRNVPCPRVAHPLYNWRPCRSMQTSFGVLIASPSDLNEERQVIAEVLHDWNSQHAIAESVILLPVRWETHALPRAGVRPQEVINRELVDVSDFVLGLFWTRFGTNTGVAESGTVEEIDRFVAANKPALLYFSKRAIDPSKIDVKQHKRLKKFQHDTYKKALTGTFSDINELKQSSLRDLTRLVRSLNRKQPVTR